MPNMVVDMATTYFCLALCPGLFLLCMGKQAGLLYVPPMLEIEYRATCNGLECETSTTSYNMHVH